MLGVSLTESRPEGLDQDTVLTDDTAARRAEQEASAAEPDETEIRLAAYFLWQERGGSDGSPEDDWFEAQKVLQRRRHNNQTQSESKKSFAARIG
jgi:Protein of unknown function (DUF2934)